MRQVQNNQIRFGEILIPDVKISLTSRDEIPKILIGLQQMYINTLIRNKIFKILEDSIPENINPNNGRPGMYLWSILVLGVIRLNCNWDYDKVVEIANNHKILRQILGHGIRMNGIDTDDGILYHLSTLKDNLPLLTTEILDQINQVVVKAGLEILGEAEVNLKGKCDSFVVETDVHYPTDINLAFDAIRVTIRLIVEICLALGIQEWRQGSYLIRKIKKIFRRIQRSKRSNSQNKDKKDERDEMIKEIHQEYIDLLNSYVSRIILTIRKLREMGVKDKVESQLQKVEEYILDIERQIDQIRRRVLNDETIPHEEKVFSIFERHTEWINKGKAGVPVELGLRVCVLEDQHGFILHHMVMEKQTDDKVAVPMVEEAKSRFPNLSSCSFDKGFYTPENRKKLGGLIEGVILPKKGKVTGKDLEIETTDEFIQEKSKHAAVESAINALENHGLDRCPDHGIEGFKRYVALAVLGRNIQILGHIVQQKKLKAEKRRQKVNKTWDEKRKLKAA